MVIVDVDAGLNIIENSPGEMDYGVSCFQYYKRMAINVNIIKLDNGDEVIRSEDGRDIKT